MDLSFENSKEYKVFHRHIDEIMKEVGEGREKKTPMNSTIYMQEEACWKKGRTCISQVETVKEDKMDKMKIDMLRNIYFFVILNDIFSHKMKQLARPVFSFEKNVKFLQHIVSNFDKKMFHF